MILKKHEKLTQTAGSLQGFVKGEDIFGWFLGL
jgi:hypothetical protein